MHAWVHIHMSVETLQKVAFMEGYECERLCIMEGSIYGRLHYPA